MWNPDAIAPPHKDVYWRTGPRSHERSSWWLVGVGILAVVAGAWLIRHAA